MMDCAELGEEKMESAVIMIRSSKLHSNVLRDIGTIGNLDLTEQQQEQERT